MAALRQMEATRRKSALRLGVIAGRFEKCPCKYPEFWSWSDRPWAFKRFRIWAETEIKK